MRVPSRPEGKELFFRNNNGSNPGRRFRADVAVVSCLDRVLYSNGLNLR
jgi:hypothetical protein